MSLFIFSILTSPSSAETPEEALARQATEYGDLRMVSSKSTDPIGIAGLWGMEGNFIVAASCKDTFSALQDIPSYPKYTSSVKRVEIVEQSANSLKVDYTEGGLGFESTSQQQWTFQPTVVPPTLTSISVGATDSPSWVQFQLYPVASPSYCQIDLKMFAESCLVEKQILNTLVHFFMM